MALLIRGIDISYCQADINYKDIKADGVKFAIIRSSYTGTVSHKQMVDTMLDRHVKGCIANGIPYGYYHYSCARTVAEAREEAKYTAKQIKRYPRPSYPVYIDVEENQISSTGRKNTTDIILAFVEEMQAQGYPSGVYLNPSWMETYVEKSRLIGKVDIWLAHWTNKSSYDYGQKMWQHGLHNIAGKDVDSNICYVNYPAMTDYWYKTHTTTPTQKKTVADIVKEVMDGKWGNGHNRYKRLTLAGYDYSQIQTAVNNHINSAKAPTIKKGCVVRVKKGAKTYDGRALAAFVYGRDHVVSELVRDRAVITHKGAVVAAVQIADLVIVTAKE